MSPPSSCSYPSQRWSEWAAAIDHERQLVWRSYCDAMDGVAIPVHAVVFHDWLARNYSDAMSVGVRRLVDGHERASGSLVRLIESIAGQAAEISLESYLRCWNPTDPFQEERARAAFQYLYPDGHVPTRDVMQSEANRLRESAQPIVDHVN
jgi:hypothetical protein